MFVHTRPLSPACECNEIGSRNSVCDQKSGQCLCHSSYGNHSCDQCNHGYYGFPTCSCEYACRRRRGFVPAFHVTLIFRFFFQTAIAIRSVRCRKCATSPMDGVCARKDTPVPGATSACPATTGIRTASRAVVRNGEARRPFATRRENVRVCPVSPGARARNAVRDIISIPSASVCEYLPSSRH